MELTEGKTFREILVADFGLDRNNVDQMSDEQVNEELLVLIGDTDEH